ncbi:MAG: cupin [bacterium]|nr:cupin [bacterium]
MVVIEKPWGKEELLEKNEKYVVKRLTMHKGHCCSIQYHEYKTETVYLLKGSLKIYIGDTKEELDEMVVNQDDFITLNPYRIHRMEAIEDAVYLEASTPELDDVVRLEDNYKRV